jgi:carbon-monoxide dehydrogenase large subunit
MVEHSVIGKSVPRVDNYEKVTGKAKYCADYKIPGICYAKLLRSPHPHARVIRVDTSRAEKLYGVRAVVTGKDAPDALTGMIVKDQYVIARDVVRYVGEPVAGVVADTEEIAEEALQLISVEYEPLPAVFDVEEAFKINPSVVIHPDLPKYIRSPGKFIFRTLPERPNVFQYWKGYRGDVDKGFQESDLIVENRYVTPRVQHSALERYNVDAWLEPDGGITLRTKKQGVHPLRSQIAAAYNISVSKIRVMCSYVGGAFGEALVPWPELVAVLLVLKSQRPVRLSFSREECFLNISHKPGEVIYVKDGVKKDGTLIARDVTTLLDVGAYSDFGAILVRSGVRAAVGQYRIPNFRMYSYGVYTNLPKIGSLRGVSCPEYVWAIEQQMDIIAEKLGMDPVDIRKKNLLKEGEENCLGQRIHSIGAEECLDKVATWLGKSTEKKPDTGPWRTGKGVAVGNQFTVADTPSFTQVKVYKDGMIEVLHSLDELGQGVNTVAAQIVAEEFGVPIEKIRVIRGDTAFTPYDVWSASSRSTFYMGNSIYRACQDAKRQLFEMASQSLGVPVESLEMRAGRIVSKGDPQKSVTITDLFVPSIGYMPMITEVVGRGQFDFTSILEDAETGQSEKWVAYFSYGAHGVEIAVNIETGALRVVRIAGCFDVQPINPKMVEQQIEGGIGWGMSHALYEEVMFDQGKIINPTFVDYKVTSAMDMPLIQNVGAFVAPAPHQEGPYGAKGFGEMVSVPVLAALGNAFYDATGVRIYDLPLTPERILKALRKK